MSDLLGTFVQGIMGEAVVAGQPEPSDPIAPTQNDGDEGEGERSGRWPDPLPASTDPARDPLNYPPTGPQVENTPTPLIGSVPFGGIILDAGEVVGQAAGGTGPTYFTIGDNGNARPGVLGILLFFSAADAASVPRILANNDGPGSLRGGAPIGSATLPLPMFIPARRLSMLIPQAAGATPSSLSYAVIGSNIGQST